MKLNKNAFPVNITLDESISIVQKEFNRKGHKVRVTKSNVHLNIVPFWVCFYDVDSKKDGKYNHYSSQIALNALTNKIQDDYLKLLEHESPQMIDNLSVALEKVEIRVKKLLISKEEAIEAITKMLSCKFEVDIKNVSLSGFEEMYIPVWKFEIEKHELFLDAVIGKVNNFNIINKKTKDNKDLFIEMINEIKKPTKLLEYLFTLIKNGFLLMFKYWRIVLMFILIILILIYLFF